MSADEEALRFKCPDCGASSGVPCTYMSDTWKWVYDTSTWTSNRVQTQVRGEFTKRPHNGRLAKLWAKRRVEEQAEWNRQREEAMRDPLAAERRAYMSFANREQQDLKLWLYKFGRVLWE